jgi:hypothetical protein
MGDDGVNCMGITVVYVDIAMTSPAGTARNSSQEQYIFIPTCMPLRTLPPKPD